MLTADPHAVAKSTSGTAKCCHLRHLNAIPLCACHALARHTWQAALKAKHAPAGGEVTTHTKQHLLSSIHPHTRTLTGLRPRETAAVALEIRSVWPR